MLPEKAKKQVPQYIEYLQGLWIDTEKINDDELMMTAFFHKSFVSDYKYNIKDNERLEFLWDSILWCLIAKLLYFYFEEKHESELTLYKIALVREENLAEVAKDIKLDNMLFLWHGEEKTWGRQKESILSDALEALIGYLYLDLWTHQTEKFIKEHIFVKIDNMKDMNVKSHKTLLQELVQKEHQTIPEYVDYDNEFNSKWNVIQYKTQVYINWNLQWEGFWSNKKIAHQQAAKDAYQRLNPAEK